MQLTSYDGFIFNSLDANLSGDYPIDANQSTWQINYRAVTRGADNPIVGIGEQTPRIITVDFVINSAITDLWGFYDKLTGRLNPTNQSTRRKLFATRPDGITVWRYARIQKAPYWTSDGEVNAVRVEFISEDYRWFQTTPRVQRMIFDSQPGGAQAMGKNTPGLALTNDGQTVVQPTYTIKRATSGNSKDSGPWNDAGPVYAWAYRRRLPFTNNLNRTISNYPVLYHLGDTSAWVAASKAKSNGSDFRVIHPNGKNVQRDLIGWNEQLTWVYFVIDKLAPGETVTYDLIYGNTETSTFSPLQYPTKPAFQMDSYGFSGTLAAVDAGKTWIEITGNVLDYDNKYQDGALYFRTGSNAGVANGKQIASHTYNTPTAGRTRITFTSAFTNTITTGDALRIVTSRGGCWMWNTTNTVERGSEYARGRWYLDTGETKPSVVDFFDPPACWQPTLYLDTADKKAQPRSTGTIVSGDTDYYSILNASRTWDGGPSMSEEGVADGVSLVMPFPISAYRWGGTFLNPNSIGTMYIGGRSSGATDWRQIDTNATAYATATAITSVNNISGTDTLQLYHGLIPTYGDFINRDWKKDNGTATAGSTTQLTDGNKSWETNKWVGATLRITSGPAAGKTKTITSSTSTQLNWSGSIGAAITSDTKYEVINPPLMADVMDGTRCTVQFDDSGLSAGPMGSEEDVHDLSVKMHIGGGKDSSPLPGERRNQIRVGRVAGNADQVVMLRSGQNENLVIDSANRIAYEQNSLTSVINRYYADPLVQMDAIDENGVVRMSQDGLPLPIGSNYCNNPNFGVNLNDWSFSSSGLTYSTSVDSTLYISSPSSCRITITGNTGPGGNITMVNSTRIPVIEGQLVTAAGCLRTTTYANPDRCMPVLGLRFFDAGGAEISTSFQSTTAYGQPGAKWVWEAHAAQAPAGSVTYTICMRIVVSAAAGAGAYVGEFINVDNMDIGSPVLFITPWKAMGGIEVTYYEAFGL